MKILKRLLLYVLPYWRMLLLIALCTAVVNALTLAQPLLIRELFDKVLVQKNFFVLKLIVAAVVLLVALKGVFSYVQGYLMNFVGLSCIAKIRDEMFTKLQYLPLGFYKTWQTGEVFSRLINDAAVMTDALSSSIVFLVNDVLVLTGAILWMAWNNPKMTLLMLVVSPLIAVAVLRFGRWMSQVTKTVQSHIADLSHILFEGIGGIQVVKTFGREPDEIERFKNKNREFFAWSMKSVQVNYTQVPVVEMLAVIGIAAIVYYGGYEVVQGKYTIGDMSAFWGYMILATNPLYRLSSTLTGLQKVKAAAERIFEVIDTPAEVESENAIRHLSYVRGKIQFENVWFRYDDSESWILQDVNLMVKPGSVVALIGPSGAGKTSLSGLIPRFFTPARGRILLDDVDISQISLRELRSVMSLVPQETYLFSGTVWENIRYGNASATDTQIAEAAKAANAHDFIRALPQGYDTRVGERGASLSVGQRQRIAMARAIVRNPRILILDEATSNLDSESEALIQQAFKKILTGRTTFVIAHRLSTIQNADQIVAIEDGRIVEVGSHHDLIAKSGLYSRLYRAQFRAVEAN